MLTAGPWADSAPMTVDPSYFSPATFEALRAASGDPLGELGGKLALDHEHA